MSEQEKELSLENTVPQEAIEEKDDYYDKYLRLAADFDNFRKRTLKERSDYIKYSNEAIVKDLLPALDNFERAIEHVQNAKDLESIVTGVQMIFSQLESTLERFGVKKISSSGKDFDPTLHEAVSYVPSPEHEANTIIQEHQKAYFLHDRLLRPALVTVAAEKKLED